MIEVYAIAAVAVLVAGGVIGILTVLAVGIRREEKDHSFTVNSPSRAASGARTLTGTYARLPGVTSRA